MLAGGENILIYWQVFHRKSKSGQKYATGWLYNSGPMLEKFKYTDEFSQRILLFYCWSHIYVLSCQNKWHGHSAAQSMFLIH